MAPSFPVQMFVDIFRLVRGEAVPAFRGAVVIIQRGQPFVKPGVEFVDVRSVVKDEVVLAVRKADEGEPGVAPVFFGSSPKRVGFDN